MPGYYRCRKCGKVVFRDSEKDWIPSICDASGCDSRLWRVGSVGQGEECCGNCEHHGKRKYDFGKGNRCDMNGPFAGSRCPKHKSIFTP